MTGAAVERTRGTLMRPSRAALDDAERIGTGRFSKAVHKQLRRVLASDGFRNSRRMTNLLRFVVSETLAGHQRRLKEYVIAVEVFGRDESFDPRTNAVVRVEASRLRHRLREYFLDAGRRDAIHIELPAGSYIPQFTTTPVDSAVVSMRSSRSRLQLDPSTLELPQGPSIAVLPFTNLSDDPGKDYFSDGVAADLSRLLSLQPNLLVLGRATTSRYKGKDVDIRTLREDLGVQYALQGTVRRSGTTVRVTAELLETKNGALVWSSAYDRKLKAADLFAIQEDIAATIAATVGEGYGVIAKKTNNLNGDRRDVSFGAYESVLLAHRYFEWSVADNHLRARDRLEKTLTRQPNYPEAWGWLAIMTAHEHAFGFNLKPDPLGRSLEAGLKGTTLGPQNQMAWVGLAAAHFFRHDFEEFRLAAQRSLEINPNDASTVSVIAVYFTNWGELETGAALMTKAIKLSPHHPPWYYHPFLFRAYVRGDYEEALVMAHKAFMPGVFWSHQYLAAAYAEAGKPDKARTEVTKLVELWPDYARHYWQYMAKWNKHPHLSRPIAAGLRKAGLAVTGNGP